MSKTAEYNQFCYLQPDCRSEVLHQADLSDVDKDSQEYPIFREKVDQCNEETNPYLSGEQR